MCLKLPKNMEELANLSGMMNRSLVINLHLFWVPTQMKKVPSLIPPPRLCIVPRYVMPSEVLPRTSPTRPNLGVQPGSVKPGSSLFDLCLLWCLVPKDVEGEVSPVPTPSFSCKCGDVLLCLCVCYLPDGRPR